MSKYYWIGPYFRQNDQLINVMIIIWKFLIFINTTFIRARAQFSFAYYISQNQTTDNVCRKIWRKLSTYSKDHFSKVDVDIFFKNATFQNSTPIVSEVSYGPRTEFCNFEFSTSTFKKWSLAIYIDYGRRQMNIEPK